MFDGQEAKEGAPFLTKLAKDLATWLPSTPTSNASHLRQYTDTEALRAKQSMDVTYTRASPMLKSKPLNKVSVHLIKQMSASISWLLSSAYAVVYL